MSNVLYERVTCARCHAPLNVRHSSIACARCGQRYPRVGGMPVLLPNPDAHVEFWRQQLALVRAQGEQTLASLEAQAAAPQLLPDTRTRLLALANGVRDQARELAELVAPALGNQTDDIPALSANAASPLQYAHYLYRDWGWEHGTAGCTENQVALSDLVSVLGSARLGRTLVLGGGACRLPYDLHRSCGATETAVLDVDPFLLVIADAVVRGATVQLTESTANIQESARSAVRWSLRAPDGPFDGARFHLLFGNGLAPPFEAETFDTVVTPWFIDQVPSDLHAFLDTIARQLRPAGRWLNHGPLIYPSSTPLAQRYAREELFDLASTAGFRIESWQTASRPYLASPLNGRGKLEWVLSFQAVRR